MTGGFFAGLSVEPDIKIRSILPLDQKRFSGKTFL
jgi:hypothetical protein